MHLLYIWTISQYLCGAEVLNSSFSATSPHQDTVAAFYEVLNVTFFMPFATARFKACTECSITPCCSAGSVSLVMTSWLENNVFMTACKISVKCVIIWVTHWSLILYFIDLWDCSFLFHFFTSLGLCVNCEALQLFILSAEKKRRTSFLPSWGCSFTVRCFIVL